MGQFLIAAQLPQNKHKIELIARAKINESSRQSGMWGRLEEIRVNCDVK
jgi:hypothetical protein